MKNDNKDLKLIKLIILALITFICFCIYLTMYFLDKEVDQWIIFILGGIISYWFRK